MWWILMLFAVPNTVASDCKQDRKTEEVRLMNDILSNTSLVQSPLSNYNETVRVYINFYAGSYIKVLSDGNNNEYDYVIIDAVYKLMWLVPCYKWNPSNYSGLRRLTSVPKNKIWKPKFLNEHWGSFSYGDNLAMKIIEECSVQSSTVVWCQIKNFLFVPCVSTGQRRWPYEAKKCVVNYLLDPSAKQNTDMFVRKSENLFNQSRIGGSWRIKHLEVLKYNQSEDDSFRDSKTNYSGVRLTVIVEREATLEFVYVICPTIVVVVLTLACFSISIDDGSRVFLSAVSIVCHYYVSNIVAVQVPKKILNLSLIVIFLQDSLIVTTLVLLVCLVCISISGRNDRPLNLVQMLHNVLYSRVGILMHTFFKRRQRSLGSENEAKCNVVWYHLACFLNNFACCIVLVFYFIYFCVGLHSINQINGF